MTCRLCQKDKDLRRSHVIPNFFRDDSGAMYPTGKSGNLQPFTQVVHTHPGKRFQRKQHGFLENRFGLVESLLCGECEQRLSALEDYARKFFYGKSYPIRLQLSPDQDSFIADYKKMKLFQVSLLWRASEAKGDFFASVTLSDQHRERLRLMLQSGDPGRDYEYFCAVSRLKVSRLVEDLQRGHGISTETGIFAPIHHAHGTWDTYMFVLGGLTWSFCVCPAGVPDIMRNSYIKENGHFFVLALNGDSFFIEFAQKAVRAGNVTKADAEESMSARQGSIRQR